MKKFIIDGIFLCKRVTGIQRYAIEITKELDKLVSPDSIEIVVPQYCDDIPELMNIRIVKYGKRSGRLWEQIDFPLYLRKSRGEGIFFENTIPLLYRKGVVVVHDVSLKVNPELFNKSIKGIITIIWRRLMYMAIMRSSMRIVTVSDFSRKEIIKYYNVDPNRLCVIYNAWQHMISIQPDNSIFNNKRITPGQYFFAMATLAANKNFTWIAKAAEHNPNEIFVIAGGGKIADVIKTEYQDLKNLIYLGYVSDSEAKALMSRCKAFLFPSFYEGFGIPPLEAVASGAKVLVLSDIECLHEIYGDYATYVNPLDYEYRFTASVPQIDPTELLNRYGWDKSAKELKKLLE